MWESRSDWEIYKTIARRFSELAVGHLGVERDVVLTPILHDSVLAGQAEIEGANLEAAATPLVQ